MQPRYNFALGLAQAAIVASPLAKAPQNESGRWTQRAITISREVRIRQPGKVGVFLIRGNPKTAMEVRFRELAARWRKETSFQSSLAAKFDHPAYREVIDMGFKAIPLLLTELKTGSKHWAFALSKIVGFDVGSWTDNPRDAAAAWLEWGKAVKFIK